MSRLASNHKIRPTFLRDERGERSNSVTSPATENEQAPTESTKLDTEAPEKTEEPTTSEAQSAESESPKVEEKPEQGAEENAESPTEEKPESWTEVEDVPQSEDTSKSEAKATTKEETPKAEASKDEAEGQAVAAATPAAPPKPTPVSPGSIVFQFVVFPLSIVLGIVGIFAFFNWAMTDHRTYNEYLHAIDQGWESERWQAAYELQFRITDRSDKLRETADIPETLRVYENSKTFKDQRVRAVLTILLGHLGDIQAEEALVEALTDKSDETRLNAVFALGRLKSKLAVPSLLTMLNTPDSIEESKRDSFYKVIAYSLGEIGDPDAVPALKRLLKHPGQVDVGWNAALALARFGDKSALGTLSAMMSRPNLEGIQTMNAKSRDLTIINALKGARMLKATSLRSEIELLKADSSFRVRQAALEVLKSFKEIDKEPAKEKN